VTFTCVVEEEGRTRRVDESDFPLTLGGAGADIEVPGLTGDEAAVFLALDDGELYAQPRGGERVSLGGRPVAASQWLRDGDELRLRGTRIRIVWRTDRRCLQVRHLPVEQPEVRPFPRPAADFPALSEADVVIHPVEYRPRTIGPGPAKRAAFRLPPWRVLVPAAVLLLAAGYLSPPGWSRCGWTRSRRHCPSTACRTSDGTARACSFPAATRSPRGARATGRSINRSR
jgi:hypothetical protein